MPDEALLTKWNRIRELRDIVNKDIEALRANGKVGSSLQATIQIYASGSDFEILKSLGSDLKFVLITSEASVDGANGVLSPSQTAAQLGLQVEQGDSLQIFVRPSEKMKCERCWHYQDDVGSDVTHPTICGRCISNLYGAGESRQFA